MGKFFFYADIEIIVKKCAFIRCSFFISRTVLSTVHESFGNLSQMAWLQKYLWKNDCPNEERLLL